MSAIVPSHVNVVMVKDVVTGEWRRHNEWSSEPARSQGDAHLPAIRTKHKDAAVPRGTFGLSPRLSNDPLPFSRGSARSVVSVSPRVDRKRESQRRAAARATVGKMLDDFEKQNVTLEDQQDLLHSESTVAIPKLNEKPSNKSLSRSSVHPLVGLLCTQAPPELVNAYREFCLAHTVPGLLSLPNNGGGANHRPSDALSVSESFVESPHPITRDVLKQMEAGWYFYVHPDGLTLSQFKILLPHLAPQTVPKFVPSEEFAAKMFRSICRENTSKLPFCEILQLVGEQMLPDRIHRNIDFVLRCFDPYGSGRVPNHMFNGRFFQKFLDRQASVPEGSMPQWRLLQHTLEALEGSNCEHSATSDDERRPTVSAEDCLHFQWLRNVYLYPQNNYKTFTEKMSLLLSTAKAKSRQASELMSPTSPLSPNHFDQAISQSAIFGAPATSKYPPTQPISYLEAKVVLLGSRPLFHAFSNNNFVFFPGPAKAPLPDDSKQRDDLRQVPEDAPEVFVSEDAH